MPPQLHTPADKTPVQNYRVTSHSDSFNGSQDRVDSIYYGASRMSKSPGPFDGNHETPISRQLAPLTFNTVPHHHVTSRNGNFFHPGSQEHGDTPTPRTPLLPYVANRSPGDNMGLTGGAGSQETEQRDDDQGNSTVLASTSPAASVTDVEPVVPRAFVSALAKEFHLDKRYTANLHAFNELGSLPEGRLSKADLSTRIYMLGSMFHLHGQVPPDVVANGVQGTPEIKTMLNKVIEHIHEGPWEVGSQLLAVIRSVSQELIYDPARVDYEGLWKPVMNELRDHKDKYKLTDVFGNAVREKKLETVVRRTCSHTRTSMRIDIQKSLIPEKYQTLKEFTAATARKYKHIGSSERLDSSYKLRNAIWRRFAFDNPHLVAPSLDGSDDDGSEPPRKRSRSSKSKGARSGDNFWSEIQRYLTEEIAKRGKRFEDPGWAKHLEELVDFDNNGFKVTVAPTMSPMTDEGDWDINQTMLSSDERSFTMSAQPPSSESSSSRLFSLLG